MHRLSLCLAAGVLVAGSSLSADRILLRAGQAIDGTFVGADSKAVRLLMSDGSIREVPIGNVNRLEFAARTPPPAPKPAPPRPAAQPAPAAAAPVRTITVPSGTVLAVRLSQAIDVDATQNGATFRSLLDDPVMLDGQVVIPRGSAVLLQATSVTQSGNIKGSDKITLKANSITFGGASYEVVTAVVEQKGKGEGKKSARKIGGGAGLGAIVGGIAGGGTGAAIGAAAGAAGGAIMSASGEEHLKLDAETRLEFRLTSSVNVRQG